MRPKLTLTFACLNQSAFTKKCLDSLLAAGVSKDQIVVVDNGSTDDTQSLLSEYEGINIIINRENLGCGVAWNQGILHRQTEWTVVMNNDVIVAPTTIEGLIDAADRANVQLLCPAMVEGSDDYDIPKTLSQYSQKARNLFRNGHVHAVFMLIHTSVWRKTGFFRASPSLLGYEDTLFFNDCKLQGISMGTTGSAWIHHYGSITQTAMKLELGLDKKMGLGDRHNYRLLGKSRLRRKLEKYFIRKSLRDYERREIDEIGLSLHGQKQPGMPINWTPR